MMKTELVKNLKNEILSGASKEGYPSVYYLDNHINQYTSQIEVLVKALDELEAEGLIQPNSYQIGVDQLVSFVDVRITPKGIDKFK
ncbi:hypothetical protein ACG9XY_12370 [Acinetobacter seifertii]|uniref:hypothetical protein n=1 Tax=Acinetobacter seifertii TaxID=1530123 RepID=UPI0029427D1B|nr:hypothetical protein [Acinetobacter seifertii]